MSRADVAIVAPYPTAGQRHAGPSGVASYAANLAGAVSAAGARVTVVAPREPDAPTEPARTAYDGVEIRRCFDRGATALPTALAAAVGTGAPVVHLQHEHFLYGGPASIPGLFPALGRARRHTRTVVTLHQVVDPRGVDGEYTRLHRVRVPAPLARGGLRAVQRSVAALADATVVHERPFAESVPGSVVIAHGVEERATPPRDEARRRLGGDGRFVVLCFGFVSPYKGLEAVLEAGRRAGPDVLVVVAGGPHPRLAQAGDGYAADLAAAYAGDGARFTGWVPDADVAAWHAAADVAVLAYPRPFASSGSFALAIAHGTPVLLSAAMADCLGAGRDAVVDVETAGMARRLRDLADGPAALDAVRAATAGMAGPRRWPAVADAHLRLYEDVLP